MVTTKRRFIFINLHGNEFLVKTLNKILFGQSVAVKHRYLLEYLLEREDIEVCSFMTRRGLSLSYTTQNRFLQSFRFLENKLAIKKNGLSHCDIKLITDIKDIHPDDILIAYSYYSSTHLCFDKLPDCKRVICQIHFSTANSDLQKCFAPHAMYNESDLRKYSGMWRRDLPWFNKEFVTIPFVFEPRFQNLKPFAIRKQKAVSVGTITYMHNITDYYGESCAQPARRYCRELGQERSDLLDSFNFDYNENQHDKKIKVSSNSIARTYQRMHSKITGGHQKQYYSFNMVEKLNDYRIAVVGEEIMGIPGIGFVEAMACGCAYVGQTVGYYEDYGMVESVHYIGYDGTKEGLIKKLEYWLRPENQSQLEKIAATGCNYVRSHFNKETVASKLVNRLLELK